MRLVENFETLVDRIRQVLLQKVKYIEKATENNEKAVADMIVGANGEGGLIAFIREVILETAECQ